MFLPTVNDSSGRSQDIRISDPWEEEKKKDPFPYSLVDSNDRRYNDNTTTGRHKSQPQPGANQTVWKIELKKKKFT